MNATFIRAKITETLKGEWNLVEAGVRTGDNEFVWTGYHGPSAEIKLELELDSHDSIEISGDVTIGDITHEFGIILDEGTASIVLESTKGKGDEPLFDAAFFASISEYVARILRDMSE